MKNMKMKRSRMLYTSYQNLDKRNEPYECGEMRDCKNKKKL